MSPVVNALHLDWTAQLNKGKNPCEGVQTQNCHDGLLERSEAPRISKALRTQFRNLWLPAVTAVTAISATAASATAAAATTTAATTMAAASAAVPTATAASATTAAALRLGTRFIHNEVSPAKILSIEGINRAVRIFIVRNFDKGKTA